jgi:hypothetical protein
MHHLLAKHRWWMHHHRLLRRNSINYWGRLPITTCLPHYRLSRVHSTIIAGTRLPWRRGSSYIALWPISLSHHLASPINQICCRWQKYNWNYRAYNESYVVRRRAHIARWISAIEAAIIVIRVQWWIVIWRWRGIVVVRIAAEIVGVSLRGWDPVVVSIPRVAVVVWHLLRVVEHESGLVVKVWALVDGVCVDFPVLDTVDWGCLDLGTDALETSSLNIQLFAALCWSVLYCRGCRNTKIFFAG